MNRILPLILFVLLGHVLFSQAQIINFKRTDLFPTLPEAEYIVQGNFDGDGLVDLVIGGEPGFQIVFNDGRKFERIVRYDRRWIHSIAEGDFNNDGFSEIAVSYIFSGKDSLAIYTNDGEGSLRVMGKFACSGNVGKLITADITGDGKTDVLMMSEGTEGVYVYANTGSGFTAPVKTSLPFIGRSISAGDFNDDGLTDLAVLSLNGNQFVYLLGNNSSTPAAPVTLALTYVGVELSKANLNLAGGDELLVSTSSMGRILKYTWTGSTFEFQNIATGNTGYSRGALAVGHLNMDTAPDVVALDWDRNQISILHNNGTGDFITPGRVIETVPQPQNSIIGDFDQDGRDDIAFTNSMSLVQILFREADDGYTSQIVGHGYGSMIAAADFNSDEAPDLAVANANLNTITILDNDHAGGFTIRNHIATGKGSNYLYAKDLDADGHADLIASHGDDNTIGIYRGNGDGTFHTAVTYTTSSPSHIAIDDFDGDSDLDLVVVNYLGNSLSFFRQQNGVFVAAGSKVVNQHPGRIVSGDLNSDGNPDLLLAFDHPLRTVKYFLNTGSLSFGDAVGFNASDSYNGTLIRDFTGDGIPDIGVIEGDIYRFYKNNGNAGFTSQRGLIIPYNARIVTTGDYNNDGMQDLAFSSDGTIGSTHVEVFLGTPDHDFVEMPHFLTYSGPLDLASVDINSDGRDDIVVAASPHYYLTTLMSLPEITLVADDKTREYGLPNPEFTGYVEGSELSEQMLIYNYDTPATIASDIGTYYISANPTQYALDNFTVLYRGAAFAITPAPLTVTAHDAQRMEGKDDPEFTGDIEGVRNNDQINVSYSTPASVDSPPGEYPITPLVISPASNYNVTYVPGKLTIMVMVGVEDELISGMKVFPNPTEGSVVFENTSGSVQHFTLYTPQGSVHTKGLLQPGRTAVQLADRGLYVLRLNGKSLKIAVE